MRGAAAAGSKLNYGAEVRRRNGMDAQRDGDHPVCKKIVWRGGNRGGRKKAGGMRRRKEGAGHAPTQSDDECRPRFGPGRGLMEGQAGGRTEVGCGGPRCGKTGRMPATKILWVYRFLTSVILLVNRGYIHVTLTFKSLWSIGETLRRPQIVPTAWTKFVCTLGSRSVFQMGLGVCCKH